VRLRVLLTASIDTLLGFKRALEEEDLWELEESDTAQYNYTRFRTLYDAEIKRWRCVVFSLPLFA